MGWSSVKGEGDVEPCLPWGGANIQGGLVYKGLHSALYAASSKKKKYCVKFIDSWCNKFKFIQKSRKGEGVNSCSVSGSNFSVAHGGGNHINRTRTPQNIKDM